MPSAASSMSGGRHAECGLLLLPPQGVGSQSVLATPAAAPVNGDLVRYRDGAFARICNARCVVVPISAGLSAMTTLAGGWTFQDVSRAAILLSWFPGHRVLLVLCRLQRRKTPVA